MAMLRMRQASRCCTDLRLRLAHLVVGWWRPASAAWPGGLAYGYSFQWLLGAGPTRHVSNAYWEGVLLVRGEKDLSLASVCHAVRSAAPCITCRFVVKTHCEIICTLFLKTERIAGIAQLGERQTEDLKVACSIHAHRIFNDNL